MGTKVQISNAVIGENPEVLKGIHLEEKNIALFNRDISSLQSEIEQLTEEALDLRVSGDLEKIKSFLEVELKSRVSNKPLILGDILELVEIFGKVSKCSSFRLVLERVEDDMCRRFHTDVNNLRMLCTYSGQGTLWLNEENVNRSALAKLEGNEEIVIEENTIQQAATGSVVILKGATYPKDGTNAIVHRSPAIEKMKEKRLLLRVDMNDFLDFLDEE